MKKYTIHELLYPDKRFPDMEDRCDKQTLELVERFCQNKGYEIVRDFEVEGADLVVKTNNGLRFIDIQVCGHFENGVYRTHKGVFSVPLDKAEFLQLKEAWFACVSKDRKHIITIQGHEIIENSGLDMYDTYITPNKRGFFVMPVEEIKRHMEAL